MYLKKSLKLKSKKQKKIEKIADLSQNTSINEHIEKLAFYSKAT